jgi:hypothetical protein
MINRLIAISLLLAMVSAHLSGLFVYAEFKINQKFIAATFCENRDRPELNCQGKCYLMKKLKAAEDNEKKQEQTTQKKSAQDLFIPTTPLTISFAQFGEKKPKPAIISFQLPQACSEILHPPPAEFFS